MIDYFFEGCAAFVAVAVLLARMREDFCRFLVDVDWWVPPGRPKLLLLFMILDEVVFLPWLCSTPIVAV